MTHFNEKNDLVGLKIHVVECPTGFNVRSSKHACNNVSANFAFFLFFPHLFPTTASQTLKTPIHKFLSLFGLSLLSQF
jgi:hypothetical protein